MMLATLHCATASSRMGGVTTVKLEHVIARELASLREGRGWTQPDLAERMRAVGCDWKTNRVTQVETLRGKVSLFEVVALSWVFEVPITRLLSGDEDVEFPNGEGAVALEHVRSALTGGGALPKLMHAQSREDTEEIRKIAKGLGVSPSTLDQIARERYGRAFTAERDGRAGDVSSLSKRAAQAKRGHATRALIAELREGLSA